MSFTIKCNECGNERVISEGDNARIGNIEINVAERGGYTPHPSEINFYCENIKCINSVELKL